MHAIGAHAPAIIPGLVATFRNCHYSNLLSLVPRPSPAPVFDRLQYAKTEGEGLLPRDPQHSWRHRF